MLAIRDLRFRYRNKGDELFAGLCHQFAPGRMTAITGPSGRGKSTLLYIIGLMLTPQQGSVLINGVDSSSLKDEARSRIRAARIGFVFQDSELDPSRRIVDAVLEPALYAGRRPQAVRGAALALLAQFGLTDRANHRPDQISGGQAQRVAVCRALVNDPDIVLADEPTGNLDQGNSDLVLDALQDSARARGHTVVIASHDPRVLARSDEVVQL